MYDYLQHFACGQVVFSDFHAVVQGDLVWHNGIITCLRFICRGSALYDRPTCSISLSSHIFLSVTNPRVSRPMLHQAMMSSYWPLSDGAHDAVRSPHGTVRDEWSSAFFTMETTDSVVCKCPITRPKRGRKLVRLSQDIPCVAGVSHFGSWQLQIPQRVSNSRSKQNWIMATTQRSSRIPVPKKAFEQFLSLDNLVTVIDKIYGIAMCMMYKPDVWEGKTWTTWTVPGILAKVAQQHSLDRHGFSRYRSIRSNVTASHQSRTRGFHQGTKTYKFGRLQIFGKQDILSVRQDATKQSG